MLDLTFNLFVLIFVLVVPGFCLQLALFPGKILNIFEKIVLSLSLSITIVPLMLLFENMLLKIPLTTLNIWINTLTVCAIGIFTYAVRRYFHEKT